MIYQNIRGVLGIGRDEKESNLTIIEGNIFFDQLSSSFSNATVYVRLENVSHADAPSQVVAQKVLHGISMRIECPEPVPFFIDIPALDKRERYSLGVHVDISGEGEIAHGDYITMQSYPISTNQKTDQVRVTVRPVK